jgi:hypothetical protein
MSLEDLSDGDLECMRIDTYLNGEWEMYIAAVKEIKSRIALDKLKE